jgi:hypothetical protein
VVPLPDNDPCKRAKSTREIDGAESLVYITL